MNKKVSIYVPVITGLLGFIAGSYVGEVIGDLQARWEIYNSINRIIGPRVPGATETITSQRAYGSDSSITVESFSFPRSFLERATLGDEILIEEIVDKGDYFRIEIPYGQDSSIQIPNFYPDTFGVPDSANLSKDVI